MGQSAPAAGKGGEAPASASDSQLSSLQTTKALAGDANPFQSSNSGDVASRLNTLATDELRRRSANAIVSPIDALKSGQATSDDPLAGDATRKTTVGAIDPGASAGISIQNPKADPTTITRGTVF